MATIRSAIEVQDRFSSVLNNLYAGLDRAVNKFETLQNVMGRSANMNAISSTADNMASSLSQVNPIVVSINNNINNINNTLNHTNNTLSNTNNNFNNINYAVNNAAASQEKLNQNIRTGQSEANGLLGGIKKIVATYLTFQAGKGIIELSDGLAQTKARLDLMNDGLNTTQELQQMIFESAQRSRSPYLDTAKSVAKMGILAKDAFNSNKEIVVFAEQMNKQFKIGGASIQEQTAGMYQLTQAMAAGKLQGDEFRSIMENAPLLAQSIAEYMGKTKGELKEMSSDGVITADIIKRAMFAAADETNKRFQQIPMTFGDLATNVKNNAIDMFDPVLQKLNELANNENFNNLVYNVVNGMATIANVTLIVMETIANMYAFMSENWGIIGPIVWGVAFAYLGFNIIALATNGILAAMTVAKAINTAATFAETRAQWGLNVALLSCPLTWIVIAIIAVIGAMVAWSIHTNGLKATWLIFTNVLITTWDSLKLAAVFMAFTVMNAWDSMTIGIKTAVTGIQNALGNMKANGLMIIQNFVNGAIDLINDLINTVNNIPGVSIEAVQRVTFGTEAMAENHAEQSARNSDLASYVAQKESNKQSRQDIFNSMFSEAQANYQSRMAGIESAKQAHANGQDSSILDMFKDNTDYQSLLDAAEGASQGAGDTAKNTGAMKDALDITEEDLKYMRDIAEQEVINRFTTAEIKVDMTNYNSVNSDLDIDGIVDALGSKVEEQMNISAEGVHE